MWPISGTEQKATGGVVTGDVGGTTLFPELWGTTVAGEAPAPGWVSTLGLAGVAEGTSLIGGGLALLAGRVPPCRWIKGLGEITEGIFPSEPARPTPLLQGRSAWLVTVP